jgi:hypothetical protein
MPPFPKTHALAKEWLVEELTARGRWRKSGERKLLKLSKLKDQAGTKLFKIKKELDDLIYPTDFFLVYSIWYHYEAREHARRRSVQKVPGDVNQAEKPGLVNLQDLQTQEALAKIKAKKVDKAMFSLASKFSGEQPGFVYKMDRHGLGYYLDKPPVPNAQLIASQEKEAKGRPSAKERWKKLRRDSVLGVSTAQYLEEVKRDAPEALAKALSTRKKTVAITPAPYFVKEVPLGEHYARPLEAVRGCQRPPKKEVIEAEVILQHTRPCRSCNAKITAKGAFGLCPKCAKSVVEGGFDKGGGPGWKKIKGTVASAIKMAREEVSPPPPPKRKLNGWKAMKAATKEWRCPMCGKDGLFGDQCKVCKTPNTKAMVVQAKSDKEQAKLTLYVAGLVKKDEARKQQEKEDKAKVVARAAAEKEEVLRIQAAKDQMQDCFQSHFYEKKLEAAAAKRRPSAMLRQAEERKKLRQRKKESDIAMKKEKLAQVAKSLEALPEKNDGVRMGKNRARRQCMLDKDKKKAGPGYHMELRSRNYNA